MEQAFHHDSNLDGELQPDWCEGYLVAEDEIASTRGGGRSGRRRLSLTSIAPKISPTSLVGVAVGVAGARRRCLSPRCLRPQ